MMPQFLLGPVDTNIDGDTDKRVAFAPGFGYKYMPRPRTTGRRKMTGLYAHVDYVFTTGEETGFLRMSAGVMYRIRKH